MKKLLSILVLNLLFGGTAHAYLPIWQDPMPSSIEKRQIIIILSAKKRETIDGVIQKDGYGTRAKYFKCPAGVKKTKMENVSKGIKDYIGKPNSFFGKQYYPLNVWKLTCKTNKDINQEKNDELMFNIKVKRDQCEAIGFTPKTEKFAECVLRLVELDVKQQQDQKIAAAQNSGNTQIANQLLQMRNDNNAQYLMNLGQQLLKPQQFNSNIYLPQTQNCFLQGFDSFAKMTCR